jgi:hypothetical protein
MCGEGRSVIVRFFEIFPQNFFSLFASPNRDIYIEALLILHRQYRSETLLKKQDLVSRLVAGLETRMLDLKREDDDLYVPDEDVNLSGRAHFLLRRFVDTGWLQLEPDLASFEESYVVPGYASKLLHLFYDILHGKPVEYNGFVYSTYSNLRTAEQDRDEHMYDALKQAYRATEELWKSLRELLDNIRIYHQRLQEQEDVKELLAEHFDRFRVLVSDRVYHPLKTFDSVPRFKQRITSILRSWLRDADTLNIIAAAALRRGEFADKAEARSQAISMIGEIMDTYDRLGSILAQIDRKNAGYTRASVERMQYYLNADRDIKGKLVEVLKAMPPLKDERALPRALADLPLYSAGYLDELSLYNEPKRREHAPEEVMEAAASAEDVAEELAGFRERLAQVYSHRKVIDFILKQLGERRSMAAAELELASAEEFVKLLLAAVKSDENGLPYRLEFREGYLFVNGYRLPELVISREEGKGHVGTGMGKNER